MGGDEFAAILFFDEHTEDAKMIERAQQIFDKVNMTVKATEGGTGISMGVVIAQKETTFTQLYERSDKALYRAKQQGRSRMTWRRPGLSMLTTPLPSPDAHMPRIVVAEHSA